MKCPHCQSADVELSMQTWIEEHSIRHYSLSSLEVEGYCRSLLANGYLDACLTEEESLAHAEELLTYRDPGNMFGNGPGAEELDWAPYLRHVAFIRLDCGACHAAFMLTQDGQWIRET